MCNFTKGGFHEKLFVNSTLFTANSAFLFVDNYMFSVIYWL